MDKRWNIRTPTSLDLVINYPAIGLVRGKATNISSEGMFIETIATALRNFSDIELTMSCPEVSDQPIQIPATIMHNCSAGIGIMFNESEKDHYSHTVEQLIASKTINTQRIN